MPHYLGTRLFGTSEQHKLQQVLRAAAVAAASLSGTPQSNFCVWVLRLGGKPLSVFLCVTTKQGTRRKVLLLHSLISKNKSLLLTTANNSWEKKKNNNNKTALNANLALFFSCSQLNHIYPNSKASIFWLLTVSAENTSTCLKAESCKPQILKINLANKNHNSSFSQPCKTQQFNESIKSN